MKEPDTRALFSQLANDPAPAPTVDIDRAIATAHQYRRRSRWLVAAAAAGVVLALTFGLLALLRPASESRPAPVVSAPPSVAPVRTAPASLDPLHPRLQLGWLPKGYTRGLWNAAVSAEFVTARAAQGKGSFEVYVLPIKGGFPDYGDLVGKPVAGPDVNGISSQWSQLGTRVTVGKGTPTPRTSLKPRAGAGQLRWQWAPGVYAQVRVVDVDDPQGMAVRIARSVRLDQLKPFAMPLTVSQPRGMRALRTAGIGATGNRMIEFGKVFGRPPSVLVNVGPARNGGKIYGANTTLNGRQAREDESASAAFWDVQLPGGNEFSVQCNPADERPATVAGNAAECRRIAESAQPVGELGDPSGWSTSPVK